MFKADMIAPCGLDCNICSQALIENDPCQGCNGPDDHKPEFCARYCGIILCRKRKEFFAGSGKKTDTGSVMNVRTILAGM